MNAHPHSEGKQASTLLCGVPRVLRKRRTTPHHHVGAVQGRGRHGGVGPAKASVRGCTGSAWEGKSTKPPKRPTHDPQHVLVAVAWRSSARSMVRRGGDGLKSTGAGKEGGRLQARTSKCPSAGSLQPVVVLRPPWHGSHARLRQRPQGTGWRAAAVACPAHENLDSCSVMQDKVAFPSRQFISYLKQSRPDSI